MVRQDAPEQVLATAAEIHAALDSYPILDEDDYSEKQYEAVHKYWSERSIKERVYYCQEAGACIFAARREDDVPDSVFDILIVSFP